MIRETDHVARLEFASGGDATAVQIAPVEAPEVKEVKAAFLLSEHGVPARHTGIGNMYLAFGTATYHGHISEFDRFTGIGAFQGAFHNGEVMK
ncbi:MAG: hypothetical protein MI807_12280 [Verrucomicrobiales bacterium]|nr:hypothetical protein [Verrucomicrobiales bacterium]